MNGCRGNANLSIPHWRPVLDIPDIGPIASSQTKVHPIIRNRHVRYLTRVVLKEFLELPSPHRAKQEIGSLAIRLEKIKPRLAKDIVPTHLECMRVTALVVIRIELGRHHELAQVVKAGGHLGLLFGLAQRRQKHAGKDRNNSDHHEQLD